MKINSSLPLQVAIWVSLWAMLVFSGDDRLKPSGFQMTITFRILLMVAFFNLAYYVLMPIYLSKGQKGQFFALSSLTFGFFLASQVLMDFWLMPPPLPPGAMPFKPKTGFFMLIPQVFTGLIVFATAAILRSFAAFEKKKQEEVTANRRRTEAELAMLKSQINPHFLLNTLNNLYGIALTEPEKTPEALLKLSNMVKYILYECAVPTVPLAHDFAFVENYIALQRLRLPPNAVLRFELPEKAPDWCIQPMILIPFIENAFKHGLTTRQLCTISVLIKTDLRYLVLKVENQIYSEKNTVDNKGESGVGLANTRQRLGQSYPGKHHLKIESDGAMHRVELSIELGNGQQ